MDITPQDDTTTTQPISDDQELAKALAGIADEPEAPAATMPTMQFEETPIAPASDDPTDDADSDSSRLPTSTGVPDVADETPVLTPTAAPASDGLDSIKQSALDELRPLIDKVNLPAEERFSTYLMLIRSTDDTSLIAPAHTAAQAITDEKQRAQALLDIIKEIDFLSHTNQ